MYNFASFSYKKGKLFSGKSEEALKPLSGRHPGK
jgi:hypothetical protein